MLKNISILVLLIFNLLAILYLLSPSPKFPDLVNSVKSDEPGDTVQISNVSAYYTNLTRTEVINFYKANYGGPFRVILNHPPEKSREIIRDTIQSYYFQEFVLPFKESLYINGFEWENDVFTKPNQRAANKLLYYGKEYKSKITIRRFPVPIHNRFISFYTCQFAIFLAFFVYHSISFRPKK